MSVRNIVLTTAGLNAIHTASSNGVNVFINYFQPIYDHRLDPNVHTIDSNPQTDVSAFSACDSATTTISNIFGEQIFNGLSGYELSQYEALLVSATLTADGQLTPNAYISYTTYPNESQSDTSRINLYRGRPLSNIVSATSNDIVWNSTENRFDWTNNDGYYFYGTSIVGSLPSIHNRYFPVKSYTPITSASGEVRGLYKCVLLSDVGNFKFNKVALYVSTLSANGSGWSLDPSVDPVLFAVCYLTTPIYKAKTGLELTNYELDVELKISDSDTAISAISFYPGTDWARVPPTIENNITEVPSLHWDGYVGIRTYNNAYSNEKPQRPLHITDPNQAQIRLGYDQSVYNELRVNSSRELAYTGAAFIPGDFGNLGNSYTRWTTIYGCKLDLQIGAGQTYYHYLKTTASYPETNLIFSETGELNSGRFVNGDLIRRDTRGMMLVTEMPSSTASLSYATSGDSIVLVAGYAKADWQNLGTYDYHDSLFSKFYLNDGLDGMKLLNKGLYNWNQNVSNTQIRLFSPGNIRFTNMNGVFELCRYFRSEEMGGSVFGTPAISKWSITINPTGTIDRGDLFINRDFAEGGTQSTPTIRIGANLVPYIASSNIMLGYVCNLGTLTSPWHDAFFSGNVSVLEISRLNPTNPDNYIILNNNLYAATPLISPIVGTWLNPISLGSSTNYFSKVWTNEIQTNYIWNLARNAGGYPIADSDVSSRTMVATNLYPINTSPGFCIGSPSTGRFKMMAAETGDFTNLNIGSTISSGIRSGYSSSSPLKWRIFEGTTQTGSTVTKISLWGWGEMGQYNHLDNILGLTVLIKTGIYTTIPPAAGYGDYLYYAYTDTVVFDTDYPAIFLSGTPKGATATPLPTGLRNKDYIIIVWYK